MAEQEKTEEATERQISRFREQGRVANSRELVAALALVAGVGALVIGIPALGQAVLGLRGALSEAIPDGELTNRETVHVFTLIASRVGPVLVLVLAVPAVVAILTSSLLTGFNLAPDALAADPARLDAFSNFQQQFLSVTPWVSLAKGVAIAACLGWAVWSGLAVHLESLPGLARLPVAGQVAMASGIVSSVLERALPAALAIGALDYLYQRWKMGEDMKMSREDVKQDHKDSDGDPQIKARRRARARQLALGSSVRAVKNADVVIANPTHFAVAIRYRKDENAAPVVLARGVDEVALRIRAEATRNDVAVIENRPLARALYARSRAGLPIPREFYAPVAQVLAVVLRRRKTT